MSVQVTGQWYVLRSKPNKEEPVWHQACALGFQVFYPRLRVKPVNPRSRHIVPFFPGYMFVHVDIGKVGLSAFQGMPHAIGLICFGGEPAHVPDPLVEAIRRRVTELNTGRVIDPSRFAPGERVRICEGALKGYEAIFDAQIRGRDRARVLLALLTGRHVVVELKADWLEPIRR